MKIKQKIAFMLILLFTSTAFFTGCGTNDKKTPESTDQKQADATTPATPSETTESAEATDQTEELAPIDISVCFWELEEYDDVNDVLAKKLKEDTNINLTVMAMDWGNEEELKLLWAASDSLPDIISTYTIEEDISRFYNWQKNGLTRTIPEELIAKHPQIQKVIDDNNVVQAVKQITGTVNFIPRPFSLKNTYLFDQGCGFFYRKDWMANVGITKEPETVDELYTMLKAFTTDDPDKNGKNDTYGLVCYRQVPSATAFWFGGDSGNWVEENGTWIPGYLSDNMIPMLQFFNKLYQEKIMDPEYATNNNNQTMQKFASGSFGSIYKNVDDMSIYKVVMQNFAQAQGIESAEEAEKIIGMLGPIVEKAGDKPTWPAIMDTSGSEISAKVTDEKLDRILGLYEYLMQPEIMRMFKYGVEGKEYEMKDGKAVPFENPNTGLPYDIASIYKSSRVYYLPTWDIDAELEGNFLPQPVKDMGRKVRDEFNPIAVVPNLGIRCLTTPAKEAVSSIDAEVRAGFNEIVMSTGDVEQNYNTWREEIRSKGMTEAIEEVNVKVKELNLH